MRTEISGEQFYTKLSINNFGGQYSYKYHGNSHPKKNQCEEWIDSYMESHKKQQFNKIAKAGGKQGFSTSLIKSLINRKARKGELVKDKIDNIVYYFTVQ